MHPTSNETYNGRCRNNGESVNNRYRNLAGAIYARKPRESSIHPPLVDSSPATLNPRANLHIRSKKFTSDDSRVVSTFSNLTTTRSDEGDRNCENTPEMMDVGRNWKLACT